MQNGTFTWILHVIENHILIEIDNLKILIFSILMGKEILEKFEIVMWNDLHGKFSKSQWYPNLKV